MYAIRFILFHVAYLLGCFGNNFVNSRAGTGIQYHIGGLLFTNDTDNQLTAHATSLHPELQCFVTGIVTTLIGTNDVNNATLHLATD